MAYFAYYRDEIDKTMIAFEFSLIELLSILNFTKSWALMKMINLSRLFYIPIINI